MKILSGSLYIYIESAAAAAAIMSHLICCCSIATAACIWYNDFLTPTLFRSLAGVIFTCDGDPSGSAILDYSSIWYWRRADPTNLQEDWRLIDVGGFKGPMSRRGWACQGVIRNSCLAEQFWVCVP